MGAPPKVCQNFVLCCTSQNWHSCLSRILHAIPDPFERNLGTLFVINLFNFQTACLVYSAILQNLTADSNFLKNKMSSVDVIGAPINVQIQKRGYSQRRVPRTRPSHCYKHAFPMRRKVVIELFTGTRRIRHWTSSELLTALLAKVAVVPSQSDQVCGVIEPCGADHYKEQNSAPEMISPPGKHMQSSGEAPEPSKNKRFRRQRITTKVTNLRTMPNLRAKDDLAVGLLTQRDLRQVFKSPS